MHSVEIFSGVHHLFIHFIGNMHAEKLLIAGAPVLENVLNKFHKQAIAFHVGLLTEEVHKLVVTGRKLINFGGYIPQFAFGADFAEVDRKDSEELFYQAVRRRNICIKQCGNVFLDEVCITNKNAPAFQIDDQGRNQPFCPSRLHPYNLEPRPYIGDMGGIDFHLPFRG